MALRSAIGRVLPVRWRPHVLDALDERGVARGSRLVLSEPGSCVTEPFTEAYPNADEILVQSLFSAISRGTEQAMFRGETTWAEYPAVPGYSQVGKVLAAGGDAGPQTGELVATCGPHASIVRRPAAEAITLPGNVALEQAAFHNLAAIAFQGVRRLEIRGPSPMIVLGAGALGYLAASFAAAAGHDVILVNRSAERLRPADDAGLATFCLADDPDGSAWPAAPFVIDLTGTPEGAVTAGRLALADGVVVLAGSTRGTLADPPVGDWVGKRLTFLGAHAQSLPPEGGGGGWTLQREREAFIGMLAAGRLDLGPLVTDVVAPASAAGRYADTAGESGSVGTVIDWSLISAPEAALTSPARRIGRLSRSLTSKPALSNRPLRPRQDGRTVRYAVVGCGDIGIQNAKALQASGAGELVAAVDPRIDLARGMAAASGAAAATDLAEALAESAVDAVVIATPHHLHHPLALAAADAGKHVVLEKPLALNAEEGREIVDACGRAGVQLTVCYTIAMHPQLQAAREAIRRGSIGRVTAVEAAWAQGRDAEYWSGGFSGRAKDDWRTRRETAGGGVLIMNASHFIYGMDWLVESHVGSARSRRGTLLQPVEVEDAISVSMEYESGVIGSLFATSATAGPPIHEIRVFGTEGRLEVLPDLRILGADAELPPESKLALRRGRGVADRTRFFKAASDALLDGADVPVTGEAALAVQVAIDLSYAEAGS